MDALAPGLGCTARPWTAGQPLPGGDMPQADFDAFMKGLSARYPGLPGALLHRYARAYGTRAERILAGAASTADLGEEVLPGLHAREIDYLRREEWAVTAVRTSSTVAASSRCTFRPTARRGSTTGCRATRLPGPEAMPWCNLPAHERFP